MAETGQEQRVEFDVKPADYKHWQLSFDGPVANLVMKVDEEHPQREGYALKLNSYDLGVDIELHDAVQRMRFEHPEVKSIVVTSGTENCFCAGANIYMLGSSTHGFKVNFCKFTNETRNYLEEATAQSGQHYIAACNGVASGGGYELALACETIFLQDDGSSAVSFPETPLLAVLPGTGGLTRLVDKRKVRRDLADVFSTLAEGVRGKRAVDWGLVDDVFPRSKFDDEVAERAKAIAADLPDKDGPGVELPTIEVKTEEDGAKTTLTMTHVTLLIDQDERTATITVKGPEGEPATTKEALREQGARAWVLDAYRQLDRAILELRFNHANVGLILLKTEGDSEAVRKHDEALLSLAESDWFAKEVLLNMARVLKRVDLTARSLFAIIEPGSCFAGSLFELAIAADRSFMLDQRSGRGARLPTIGLSSINFGALPMSNGHQPACRRAFWRQAGARRVAAESNDAI